MVVVPKEDKEKKSMDDSTPIWPMHVAFRIHFYSEDIYMLVFEFCKTYIG